MAAEVSVPTADRRDAGALEVEPDGVVDMVPISAPARTVTSRMHHATGGDFSLALGESRRAGDRLEVDAPPRLKTPPVAGGIRLVTGRDRKRTRLNSRPGY